MEKVLKDLDCDDRELSILFTNDEFIAELNRKYLNREGPTNVLAFPMSGNDDIDSSILGDVVISVDTAIRESEECGEGLDETIYRLLIHGILHLQGYDHLVSREDEKKMQREEERLLRLILED